MGIQLADINNTGDCECLCSSLYSISYWKQKPLTRSLRMLMAFWRNMENLKIYFQNNAINSLLTSNSTSFLCSLDETSGAAVKTCSTKFHIDTDTKSRVGKLMLAMKWILIITSQWLLLYQYWKLLLGTQYAVIGLYS